MTGGRHALWQQLKAVNDRRYEGVAASAALVVAKIERNSAGAAELARGTIDGAGDFTVPLRGAEASPGDHLLVRYKAGSPASAELEYVRHIQSDQAGAGILAVNADLPAPAFATVPFETAITATPGSITARLTVHFLAVEEKYRPSGYTVSYRVTGGQWSDVPVPHLGGEQLCVLPVSFAPGASVDVKLRARYNWASAESVPSETRTTTVAADTASPGDATGLLADTSVLGALVLLGQGTTDNALWAAWQYEIATDSAGGGLTTVQAPGQYLYQLSGGGTRYAAVRPVSKSGTLGGRYPASGFAGPYTIVAGQAPDTTPPPVFGAPTLAGRTVQLADGSVRAFLKVTLPAYAFPSDYDHTVIRVYDGTTYQFWTLDGVATEVEQQSAFGVLTVDLQGVDKAGNRQAGFGASATVTITAPGLPGPAGDVTTSSVSLGVKLAFTRPADADWVRVWRATDNTGTGAAVIADRHDGTTYIDSLYGVAIASAVYYYKIEGVNAGGLGAVSPNWVAGTVGAYDGSNLAVNSIDANKLAATLVLTQFLRTATAGTRWEIEGHTGGANQDQVRMYELVGASDILRVLLQGTGITVKGDSGGNDIVMSRRSDGSGSLKAGSGLEITNSSMLMDLSTNNGIRFSGAGLTTPYWFHRVTYNAATVMGLIVDTSLYAPDPFVIGSTTNALDNVTVPPLSQYVAFDNGQITASRGITASTTITAGGAVTANSDGLYAKSGAQQVKVSHDGTNGYLNSSVGAMLVMGTFASIVNQANTAYVECKASAFTVSSSGLLKRDVARGTAGLALLRQLTPTRFRYAEETDERLGFIAEDVAPILPAVIRPAELAATEGGPARQLPGIDLMGLVSVVVGAVQELSDQVDTLTARLAALEARG